MVYFDLLKHGIIGASNPVDLITKLLSLDDPMLKRLGYAIQIAGAKYGTALAKPLGYYAMLAIHNTAIDDKWDGGSEAEPYGSPDTPA